MFAWPVSIYPHDSLDIIDPHTQYARCSNLKLLKQVQDSVTCVSTIWEKLSDKLTHFDVSASNRMKPLGLGKIIMKN